MKTLLIVLLSLSFLGVAFFSRPSEQSFKQIITAPTTSESGALVKAGEGQAYLANATFRDRYLWTAIQKDSRTAYIGAFGHWFEIGAVAEAPAPPAVDVKKAVDIKKVKLPV